jgi:hypothetical protein
MTVALAATFDPRGEIARLIRLYPQIQSQYSHIVISLPPKARPDEIEQLKGLPGADVFVNEHWTQGRYMALKAAYETGADHIHYCDLDRLIRWVETRPAEWQQIVQQTQQCECLVIGRTEAAWATHPQVMIQVDKVINSVFSYMLEGEFDIGSGSKGFSRDAVGFILANSRPERAIGTDAEWAVLLYRAGFLLESVEVDGLDWEIPDQFQEQAADRARQAQQAESYDADVRHWFYRVGATVEVVEAGLDAMQRELNLSQNHADD